MDELDPYEKLRLQMNETFDMSGVTLQPPSVIFTFEAVSAEAAAAAGEDMRASGTLGFVEGWVVAVGLDCYAGMDFGDNLACIGLVAAKAAGL